MTVGIKGNAFVNALHKTEVDMTTTWNGAVANATTHSKCLDLFAQMGNYQTLDEQEFNRLFNLAWNEDKLVALRLLFFNRDVRGGQKVKKYLQYLMFNNNNKVFVSWLNNNFQLIPEYGYWKDLYSFYNTPLWDKVVKYWCDEIKSDYEHLQRLSAGLSNREPYINRSITLAAKYAPSERYAGLGQTYKGTVTNDRYKADFIKHFKSPYIYRKTITALRTHLNIVEKQMSSKNWNEIDYEAVPSVAFMNYRKAFARHDASRFKEFVGDVTKKVHAGVLTPVDVVKKYSISSYYTTDKQDDLEKIWSNLDDVFGAMNSDTRLLPIADCSASMRTHNYLSDLSPLVVAHALTIYSAERNLGYFKNLYMTFSNTAKFYTLPGTSLRDNLVALSKNSEVASTNIQAVFGEILRVAVANKVPQADMPTTLLFLSDMQFNEATNNTARNIDAAKVRFEHYGYECPTIIFWNLNSASNFAGTQDDTGVVLVSGYSEQMLKFILNATPEQTPLDIMMEVVNNQRYERIVI